MLVARTESVRRSSALSSPDLSRSHAVLGTGHASYRDLWSKGIATRSCRNRERVDLRDELILSRSHENGRVLALVGYGYINGTKRLW